MTDCPQCGALVKPAARYCSRCGMHLSSPGAPAEFGLLAAGTSLQGGRYQVIGQLGQGGMGAVYLARDMELFQRLCVVKQMRPFFASAGERRKAEEDFKREAEVLARLNQPGHPRIPEVFGYFVEGGNQYLVLKYIEGESLERRLERPKRPLSETQVIRCAIEVSDALIYLHNRKPLPVIHRDIKPANILIDAEDRVWLVDFGLARAATSQGARVMVAGGKTVAAGTPGYTPLEQWQMQTTPKSDIYALGATMHHLLTGRDPRDRFSTFAELDLSVLRSLATFPPLAELRPDLKPALAALVARCLDADPRARPTAAELKTELTRLAPTGSRFFDAARQWSPTIGDLIGAALASFVRSLFGGRGTPKQGTSRTAPPPSTPTTKRPRLSIPCLACGGDGVTRSGQPCPLCRGSGTWWQES